MSVNVMGKDEVLIAVKGGNIMAFEYDGADHCLKEIPVCDKDGTPIASIGVINQDPN